ncbi:MAG: type IX secretion system membrane protein PorP/SprF [Bacteroidetes bacterium]|nr:type IX secretion system membrane protein PorP/SprF [Bacteroidota bacterium]
MFFTGIVSIAGWSQTDPLYSQFMTNPYLINPALTGTYNYYQIIMNNRLQWVGLPDAPITNTISMYGPMVKHPMGLGGFFMQDKFGPQSKLSFNGTYAYNYALAEDLKISMGLMLGLYQYKLDGTELNIENEDDPYFVEGQIYANYKPDASVGLYLYSSTYHAGFSVTNLFGNKLDYADNTTEEDTIPRSAISRMKQHFYIHGGYKYFINREFAIEPTLVFRKVGAVATQLDFNVRAWYGKRSWEGIKLAGGISYRTSDAINILIGINYQRKIEFGYAYDIVINNTRQFHSGSHEVMFTFKFNDIKEY